MKLLVLAAFIAAVSSGPLSEQQPGNQQQWPWQSGKQYRYDVNSHTLARLPEGASSGNAFRAQLIVRVKSPGQLQAKLENPQHAYFHQQLANNMALPSDLKYAPVENLDKPFEITVEGGRVMSLRLPSTFSLAHENLLKGLLSTLQVDLSAYHVKQPSNFDKEQQQGLFRKMEVDVTGDCETLYSVSPVSSEWRRELPQFASHEDPMEITKSKNYGHCHHRVAYHFGVPQEAEWTGTAHQYNEKQFISHSAVSRILAGQQGTIYKAETTSSVHVHPHLYGKQKAEVHSFVQLNLASYEENSGTEWQTPEASRQISTLLYAMSMKQVAIHDRSSSESDSSSHEHIYVNPEEPQGRVRRYAQQHAHYGYSASDSSSDSSSAYINDDVPKMNEPAYAALYMSHQPRGDKKQNAMNVQKLLQDLAQQLQNPNNMPKGDFLSKFNILVRVIAAMSTDQLAQTSRSIEVGKSSNNIVKADMWMIYRDAVVQAGTPPAFQQIKTWIKTKKIEGEEAAQVISTLASTLRYPTKEIMTQFFDLAMSPEVQQDQRLSTAALISATKFINLGQVNNITAHSYYPTHMYGRLAHKHDRFVIDDILPRLSEGLKNAIEQKQSSKAQVYIKAIGNLGHPEILHVFAPYLEGKYQVTTYLRVQMVSELRHLAEEKDKYTRSVLYSILRNTAEPYEVRVAAILNIFAAEPNAEMMQVMAQMTNDDPSIQVRTVLKNGIETAANLKDPRYRHLAKLAQAVKDIVTPEKLGQRASAKYYVDNQRNEDENSYLRETSHIGSEDTAMPKHSRLMWRSKYSGWATENTVSVSYSDVQEVLDYIKQMFYQPRKSEVEHKFSAQKISEMLNIQRGPQTPVESAFSYEYYREQRFFSYDENEFKRLVNDIRQYMMDLEQGIDKHYTRVLNADQVSVMFPIASGMPFIYKYKQPVVFHLQTKAKGKIERNPTNPKSMSSSVEKEIQMTFARNIDGSAGFMDTLSNQLASAGVVRKNQLNLALKVNANLKARDSQIKIQHLRPDQDSTIAHYSVWPYTSSQKKDSLVPISQDPETKLVERPRKISQTDYKIGQQAGAVFQFQGYSYSKDFKNAGNLIQTLYNFFYLTDPADLALTHYNVKYLGKQSQNKAATIRAVYDEFYNLKDGQLGQAENIQDVSPNSHDRRENMAKRVSSGINSPRARVVDWSLVFDGPQKQEYTFTAAVGDSPVDSKIQAVLYAGRNSNQRGNEQINAVVKVNKPAVSYLNYLEALNRDVKMTYEADIKLGQNGNIHIQGSSERSPKYTEELKNSPSGKLCEQQISTNNKYQPACHTQLVKAYAPDQFKMSVDYKDINPLYINWFYQSYKALKQQTKRSLEENMMERSSQGKLKLEVEASYIDKSLSFKFVAPQGSVSMDNIAIPGHTQHILSMYSPFSWFERFGNYESNYQYQPYCTVDGNKVRTFANRSYNYELSPSWHVVMQDEFNSRGQWEDLVILARRPSQQQQEIYISYKSETGKDLEIEIQPWQLNSKANVKVQSNGKKISEGDLTIYWDENVDSLLLQYYTNPEGVLMLNIADGRLRLMSDGQRLVVTSQYHRKTNRGICGHNTGEPRDDYMTPNGLVDQPQYYGASYALDGDKSDPKTQQLKTEAKQQAYQARPKYTMILRSDSDWQQSVQREKREWGSHGVYRTKSHLKSRRPCQLEQQVQYHQNEAEICITTTPLPACPSHCQGQDYQVQPAQVICQSSADMQFQTYRNQIQRGENPEVTGVPKVEQYRAPSSCRA